MIKIRFSFFAPILSLLFSCKAYKKESSIKTVTIKKDLYWSSNTINMCWENDGPTTQIMRNRTQDFVQKEFDKTTIKMVGWNKCLDKQKGLHLFIYDDPDINKNANLAKIKNEYIAMDKNSYIGFPGHPHVRGFGNILDGMNAGVILTFALTEVAKHLTDIANKFTEQGRDNLLDSITLHELGHAIGLKHESLHSKSDCASLGENMKDTDIEVSNYNKNSVMNRCHYRSYDYNKGQLGFNDDDIIGISAAYPKIK